MKFVSNEIRRARPLLGTFVEIRADGGDPVRLNAAIDRAFAAVEKVHWLMSYHDPLSDVSRVNRLAARRSVQVHPWTWKVLRRSLEFAAKSDGAFDPTVAPLLVEWGIRSGSSQKQGHERTDYRCIELLKENRVRFHHAAAQIDLGGIAKGFAVDQAIRVLKASKIESALVNAGGDLRGYGAIQTIAIRHPRGEGWMDSLELNDEAMATSGGYFTRKKWQGRMVNHLVDPAKGDACRLWRSVTVRAGTCLEADALTKVVMVRGEDAREILGKYRAAAFLVTRRGEPVYSPGWHATSRS